MRGFTRKRAERKTFPEHLPRERVVIDPPTACECCGSNRLRKLGEDVTRTLEVVPRQWKVIETVREKFTCRDCEKISQAPAPFHAIARGWAGPSLLAMIMFEKFGQHQPLNRQAERYALEGVPIALSTMADAVGRSARRSIRCFAWWKPMSWRPSAFMPTIRRCRFWPRARPIPGGAGFTFGTTGRSAAPGRRRRCSTTRATARASILRRIWPDMPASCRPTPMTGTTSSIWRDASPARSGRRRAGSHARRPFFAMADIEENARRKAAGKKEIPLSPIAIEVVRRIDALFEIERSINGKSAEERLAGAADAEPAAGRGSPGLYARAARQALPWARPGQGVQLHPEALGELHPVPRGRPRVSLQQCRRTRAARHRSWAEVMAVLRIRSRRAARRSHVQPDRHGQNEWHRSAGLARRRPRPHRRPSRSSAGRTSALELDDTASALSARAA